MKLKFLNIDLEVRSHAEPVKLIAYFKKSARILRSDWSGRDDYLLAVEIRDSRGGPAKVLARFNRLLSSLPSAALDEWRGATDRRFDFGYEFKSGGPGRSGGIIVPEKLIAIANRWQAAIAITVYPGSD